MNEINEEKIKSASLRIHELFWTWDGIGDYVGFIPSSAQIENHIRDLVGLVIARGTPHSSGRIFVDVNDDGVIEIYVHFYVEHLEKEAKWREMSEKEDIPLQLRHAQEQIKHAEGMLKKTGLLSLSELRTHILSATNALKKVSLTILEEEIKRG